MPAPLAYLISWTTYGTWLSGDERGWVESGEAGIKPPDEVRRNDAGRRMRAPAVILSPAQRALIEATTRKHCEIRGWPLHAVNPRTNHVHVVVTADARPEEVMNQLKAWCSRRLSEGEGAAGKRKWWTEHGSTKWINNEEYFQNAVHYVLKMQ